MVHHRHAHGGSNFVDPCGNALLSTQAFLTHRHDDDGGVVCVDAVGDVFF
jgi:hypothetical protein